MKKPESKLWHLLRDGTRGKVHHLLSRRLFIIDGKNLGPRLMDDDCTYDGSYEMPKDNDGWMKILERMIS
jgi:hypothetical protein